MQSHMMLSGATPGAFVATPHHLQQSVPQHATMLPMGMQMQPMMPMNVAGAGAFAVPVCWPMSMPMQPYGAFAAPAAYATPCMATGTAPGAAVPVFYSISPSAGAMPTIVIPTPTATPTQSGAKLPPNPNKRPPKQQQQFLQVPSPKAGGATGTASAADDDGIRNLYVSSLPNEFSTQELLALFAPFGNVLSARYLPPTPINPNAPEHIAYAAAGDQGKASSRGFGFVCFEKSDDAVRAMQQMIGRTIGQSKIQVRPSRRHSDGSVVGQFSSGVESSPAPSRNPSTLSRFEESVDLDGEKTPAVCDTTTATTVRTPSLGPSSADASQAVSRSISSIEPKPSQVGPDSFSMATLTALMDSIVAVNQ